MPGDIVSSGMREGGPAGRGGRTRSQAGAWAFGRPHAVVVDGERDRAAQAAAGRLRPREAYRGAGIGRLQGLPPEERCRRSGLYLPARARRVESDGVDGLVSQ